MPDTGRMFVCALCRAQVVLCRRCDRGQIYCGRSCATRARWVAQKAAGQRYQSSRSGRFAHAARARRYRARCKIVTHQGSDIAGGGDLLPVEAVVAVSQVGEAPASAWASVSCTCCGARCSAAVRLGFVRHDRRAPDQSVGANPTATPSDEHSP
jgi:hypothetical protein